MQPTFRKGLRYITNSDYRFIINSQHGFYHSMPDDVYLERLFKAKVGTELNLSNPKTFNEKLQWLKLFDRRPEYTTMVDKYAVKQWVADRIGEEYIIPTLGVWNNFDEIDVNALPDQFVLKCTHDSGSVVICRDKHKFSKEDARKKINHLLKRNYYLCSREWPYKNVQPRILAEQYLEDNAEREELTDYKIHCYNGVPKVVQIISNRFAESGMCNDHYTTDWERLDLRRSHYRNAEEGSKRPDELPQLLESAAILSNGIPYIRVDFYIVNHRIYFGELTFFPASGFNPFDPEYYDGLFGSWIKLPIDK